MSFAAPPPRAIGAVRSTTLYNKHEMDGFLGASAPVEGAVHIIKALLS
jgi:hypothetical protein